MKKKKKSPKTEKKEIKDINFCIECADDLENFSLTPTVVDMEAIVKNFENCKTTGKYKGELCSKIFIASLDDFESGPKKGS